MLSQLGIVGTALFLAFLVAAVWLALSRRRRLDADLRRGSRRSGHGLRLLAPVRVAGLVLGDSGSCGPGARAPRARRRDVSPTRNRVPASRRTIAGTNGSRRAAPCRGARPQPPSSASHSSPAPRSSCRLWPPPTPTPRWPAGAAIPTLAVSTPRARRGPEPPERGALPARGLDGAPARRHRLSPARRSSRALEREPRTGTPTSSSPCWKGRSGTSRPRKRELARSLELNPNDKVADRVRRLLEAGREIDPDELNARYLRQWATRFPGSLRVRYPISSAFRSPDGALR